MKVLPTAFAALFLFFLLPHGTSAATETVLHSFCSQKKCADGDLPNGVIDLNGMLYGTTVLGGAKHFGTVFSINPTTGAYTVLHDFPSCSDHCRDGVAPDSGVVDGRGKLYGTTNGGGANSYGTVFSLDPTTGKEKVIYSFCSQQKCADGDEPAATPIYVDGMLYGTTLRGGSQAESECAYYGCGVVYSLDPKTGVETVLYAFCSQAKCRDGMLPGSVIAIKGLLYGTSFGGGNGQGTVYSVNPTTGVETVLYSFCSQTNCPDGAVPGGSLVSANGVLYGTTAKGGVGKVAKCHKGGYGCGTLFELDPATGAETVLYSFCSRGKCKDGKSPSQLIDVNGTLYGTTSEGGRYADGGLRRGGTVFSFDPTTGAERVLYSFCRESRCADGNTANGLIGVKKILYGTTNSGGSAHTGGTAFSLNR